MANLYDLNREISFYLQLLFQTPIQFWVGWQFYVGAWKSAKHKSADMNTLIAVGTSAAYLYSILAMFFPYLFSAQGLAAQVYFDTAGAIVVLILLGRLLEARAKGQTSEAIKKLIGLQAKTARIVRDGQEMDIPVEEVKIGDIVDGEPGHFRIDLKTSERAHLPRSLHLSLSSTATRSATCPPIGAVIRMDVCI